MDSFFQDTTFCIQTFGCQMNKHDSERISGMLESLGSCEVAEIEDADFVVFMTCCVREAADSRLYGRAASLKNIPVRKESKFDRRLVAIGGCIGQRDGARLHDAMDHIDVVFGTHNIASLPNLLKHAALSNEFSLELYDESADFPTGLPIKRQQKWAAWLPITIGCDNFCSYCIVPYVRGREKSRPIEEVIREAERYIDEGVKEITLLGQNVNSYGRDLYGSPRFYEVLDRVSGLGVDRLRFATSHPKDLSDEVIKRFETLDNLMPALHLPVQSGSNRVLKEMNRNYTREHYLGLIDKIRIACPDIALSSDVIVGFPGETESDFEDTLKLVEEVGYTQVFSFIYSPRAGTPAAKMKDDTPHEVIQDRFDRLFDVIQKGAYKSNMRDKDSIVPVLVEGLSKKDSGNLLGKTPKNQTVHARIPADRNIDDIVGNYIDIKITEPKTWYLNGEVVE